MCTPTTCGGEEANSETSLDDGDGGGCNTRSTRASRAQRMREGLIIGRRKRERRGGLCPLHPEIRPFQEDERIGG